MKIPILVSALSVLLLCIIVGGCNSKNNFQAPSNEAKNSAAQTTMELCPGQQFKEGETVFLACPGKNKDIFGPLSVTFGAQIIRPDGKDYEAMVIFGDGEETSVAHWSPNLFNEEIEHTYAQSGEYEASLVLVPKDALDADVLSYKKKVQDLDNLILIKKLRIKIQQSGESSVE